MPNSHDLRRLQVLQLVNVNLKRGDVAMNRLQFLQLTNVQVLTPNNPNLIRHPKLLIRCSELLMIALHDMDYDDQDDFFAGPAGRDGDHGVSPFCFGFLLMFWYILIYI